MDFKKRVMRNISYVLIIVGLFIIIIQPFSGVTGAAIDLASAFAQVWFFIGLAMVIGGGIVLMANPSLEEKLVVSGLNQVSSTIEEYETDMNKVSLVIDASAAIKYGQENLREFEQFLRDFKYGKSGARYEKDKGPRVIMTDENYNEVGNSKVRKVLEKYTIPPEKGYEEYRRRVRRALKLTKKHQDSLEIFPYLKDWDLFNSLTRRKKEEIKKAMKKITRDLKDEGFDVYDRDEKVAMKKTYDVLVRGGFVDKGDIDAVSAGGHENEDYETFIFGRDSHIEDSVNDLRKNDPRRFSSLHYIGFKD